MHSSTEVKVAACPDLPGETQQSHCGDAIDCAHFSLRQYGDPVTSTPPPALKRDDDPTLTEAFRALHGPRLLGFAMLVTLGEERTAARVAGDALVAGAQQAAALRHPERAAAWLRARALREIRRNSRSSTSAGTPRRAALAGLGVDDTTYEALSALSVEERAAIVASAIERFEPLDIETILGALPAATRRAVAAARVRYLEMIGARPADEAPWLAADPRGELASRVSDVAARAMSAGGAPS